VPGAACSVPKAGSRGDGGVGRAAVVCCTFVRRRVMLSAVTRELLTIRQVSLISLHEPLAAERRVLLILEVAVHLGAAVGWRAPDLRRRRTGGAGCPARRLALCVSGAVGDDAAKGSPARSSSASSSAPDAAKSARSAAMRASCSSGCCDGVGRARASSSSCDGKSVRTGHGMPRQAGRTRLCAATTLRASCCMSCAAAAGAAATASPATDTWGCPALQNEGCAERKRAQKPGAPGAL
jgi:hypothetical protein